MDHDRSDVVDHHVERGWDGGRRVDHQQVTRQELVGQRVETSVHRALVAAGHEQPDVVAPAAAGFGRLVRLVVRVEAEVDREQRWQLPAGRFEDVEHHPGAFAE